MPKEEREGGREGERRGGGAMIDKVCALGACVKKKEKRITWYVICGTWLEVRGKKAVIHISNVEEVEEW